MTGILYMAAAIYVCRRRRIESGGCKHPTHLLSSHPAIQRSPNAAEWPPNRRIEIHSDKIPISTDRYEVAHVR